MRLALCAGKLNFHRNIADSDFELISSTVVGELVDERIVKIIDDKLQISTSKMEELRLAPGLRFKVT